MTTLLTPIGSASTGDLAVDDPWCASPDPFQTPMPIPIAEVTARQPVVVAGVVTAVTVARWRGGIALEVSVKDETGTVVLAFLGRRHLPLAPGAELVARGTACLRNGRLVLLNPYRWVTRPA